MPNKYNIKIKTFSNVSNVHKTFGGRRSYKIKEYSIKCITYESLTVKQSLHNL